jgi:hypothetical protein
MTRLDPARVRADAPPTDIRILAKAGALRSGHDTRGSVFHAVPKMYAYCGPALCGSEPAIQWGSREGKNITCPRCKRLLRLEVLRGAAAGLTDQASRP